MSSRALIASLITSGLLVSLHGCNSKMTDRGGDSESHFLATCVETTSCGTGLECLCGVCTRSCSSASCSDLDSRAECANAGACASPGGKICDVACLSDDACSNVARGATCVAGHCRAGASYDGGASRDGRADLPDVGPTPEVDATDGICGPGTSLHHRPTGPSNAVPTGVFDFALVSNHVTFGDIGFPNAGLAPTPYRELGFDWDTLFFVGQHRKLRRSPSNARRSAWRRQRLRCLLPVAEG